MTNDTRTDEDGRVWERVPGFSDLWCAPIDPEKDAELVAKTWAADQVYLAQRHAERRELRQLAWLAVIALALVGAWVIAIAVGPIALGAI